MPDHLSSSSLGENAIKTTGNSNINSGFKNVGFGSSGPNLDSIGSSGYRPYYAPSTFQSPLKVREPSFNTYTGATIVSNTNSSAFSGSSGIDRGNNTWFGDNGVVSNSYNGLTQSSSNSGINNASSIRFSSGSASGTSMTTGRISRGEYDYLDIGSTGDTIAELLRSMLRLYGKIFISQPWRVGRLLLQVGDWAEVEERQAHMFDDFENYMADEALGPNAPYDPYREGPINDSDYDVYKNNTSNSQKNQQTNNSRQPEQDDDDDDDLYGEPRPANKYAYRSGSSLSFRSNSRRSYPPEDEEYELDEEEEELDDEMSYFTSVGGDLSTRKIRTRSPHKNSQQPHHTNIQGGQTSSASPRQHNGSSYNTSSKRPKSKTQSTTPSRQNSLKSNTSNGNNDSSNKMILFEPYVNRIQPLTADFMDIVVAIHQTDGLRGIWRAVNTSFILDAFQVTIEAWLSGFYSSLSGVPDPHFLDVAFSPTPGASLITAVAASITTAVILAPLSIIKTRLVTTTLKTGPRSVRTSLRELQSWICPWSVLFPTILYAGTTSLVHKSTGYVIHVVLGIDRTISPFWNGLLTLTGSIFEVGVKLPLETVVRRSHLSYLISPDDTKGGNNRNRQLQQRLKPQDLIVKPIQYEGVFGTMWSVISGKAAVETLYRGWRVSVLGALSEWGLETLDGQDLGDAGKERF